MPGQHSVNHRGIRQARTIAIFRRAEQAVFASARSQKGLRHCSELQSRGTGCCAKSAGRGLIPASKSASRSVPLGRSPEQVDSPPLARDAARWRRHTAEGRISSKGAVTASKVRRQTGKAGFHQTQCKKDAYVRPGKT